MEAKIDVLTKSVNDLKTSNGKIIASINSLTEKLTSLTRKVNEHTTNVSQLSSQNEALRARIDSTEAEIEWSRTSSSVGDEIIFEVIDRQSRMKNALLYNLPETRDDPNSAGSDYATVENILDFLELGAKPMSVARMGKPFNTNKGRPLKLYYSNHEDVFELFSAQKRLRTHSIWKDLRFSSDRTKNQQEHMAFLRQELLQRRSNGEHGLIIKYIKGTPFIINTLN